MLTVTNIYFDELCWNMVNITYGLSEQLSWSVTTFIIRFFTDCESNFSTCYFDNKFYSVFLSNQSSRWSEQIVTNICNKFLNQFFVLQWKFQMAWTKESSLWGVLISWLNYLSFFYCYYYSNRDASKRWDT